MRWRLDLSYKRNFGWINQLERSSAKKNYINGVLSQPLFNVNPWEGSIVDPGF